MKPAWPWLLASLLLATAEVAAEPLGRLFLTPERRAALDRQRRMNAPDTPPALDGAVVSLDGVVIGSSGRSTVWVNRQARHEGMAGGDLAVRASPRDPARAVLAADQEPPASLKVGEAIRRAGRDKIDGLGGGRISVSR